MKTALTLTVAVLVVIILTAMVSSGLADSSTSPGLENLASEQLLDPYPVSVQRVPILYMDFWPGLTPPPYP